MAWKAGKHIDCKEGAQQVQEAQQQALCPSWSKMVLQLAWWVLWEVPVKGVLQQSKEVSEGQQRRLELKACAWECLEAMETTWE
jgi:hypothetical protein